MDITKYCGKYDELTRELLKKCAGMKPEGNAVISPFSILTLLAMAMDAAGNGTKDEIVKAICGNIGFEELCGVLKELQGQLAADGAYSSANCAVVREDIAHTVTEDYESRLHDKFDGKLFTSSDITGDMNRWVRDKTNGMIDGIMDEPDKDLLFCLADVAAFDAEWKQQYKDTQVDNDDFYNADGTVSRVKMLYSGEFVYVEDEQYTGFMKPYKDAGYSYMALLPKDEKLTLQPENFDISIGSLVRCRQDEYVDVVMPEFKITSDLDLTDICQSMGITTAFTPDADFSGLSNRWLMLKKIAHKTHIEVDRKGTKATAVTYAGIMVGDCEIPKCVQLNRPFIFAIVHDATGIPVFIGIVNHLEGLTGDDCMTRKERWELCKPYYDEICDKMTDEDGCFERVKGTPETDMWDRMRAAAWADDIEALKKVHAEVMEYFKRKDGTM